MPHLKKVGHFINFEFMIHMSLNTIFLLFNIGGPEIVVIVLVIIIFFGSKRIPDLARGLGKGMREFKNATSEIQREIKDSSKQIQKDLDPDKSDEAEK